MLFSGGWGIAGVDPPLQERGAGSQQLWLPDLALAPATRGDKGAKAPGPFCNNTRRDTLRRLRGRRITRRNALSNSDSPFGAQLGIGAHRLAVATACNAY